MPHSNFPFNPHTKHYNNCLVLMNILRWPFGSGDHYDRLSVAITIKTLIWLQFAHVAENVPTHSCWGNYVV